MLTVTDDSGFLALVVPGAYDAFVARDWTLDQLLRHLRAEMSRARLLIWGTGLEGEWTVDVRLEPTSVHGFREVVGPLRVEGRHVLLTNYESLTTAAQFEDVRLPEARQAHLLLTLDDGDYRCRIVQMFDPERQSAALDGAPDFVVELIRTRVPQPPLSHIPWFEGDSTTPAS